MTPRPLAGRSIVVTRSRAQSGTLTARLEQLGADVIELPVIAIDHPADGGAALAGAADRLVSGGYEWVALTSPNAADRLLTALGDRPIPGSVRWAAVGTGTAAVLVGAGLRTDLAPTVSLADSLADAFPQPKKGAEARSDPVRRSRAVLFPRAETVRSGLAAGLRAKGWEVDEVVAYRTVAGDPHPESVRSARRADAVAFTSSSTVERTVEFLGPGAVPAVIATIGPVTSASARAAGLQVSIEADPHTLDGLVAALVDALAAVHDASSGAGPDSRLP